MDGWRKTQGGMVGWLRARKQTEPRRESIREDQDWL